ncbi:hypothetical protein JOL79_11520 [Microbispora sp. RL4-1S]|uniref:Uncharacterized protein n=1 Tax=Microbispora oryzae TaxID=2806554 RepID=A0A941AJQ8_9ACTN|nr:hypothetical protein [Microbispora oryzae]MBP2704443.1 hypothetical protein [Microbispora oryzae]
MNPIILPRLDAAEVHRRGWISNGRVQIFVPMNGPDDLTPDEAREYAAFYATAADVIDGLADQETPVERDDTRPLRFQLVRQVDVTGVSGTGVVADGVLWPDGTVSIRWRGDKPSVVFWQDLAHAVHVHGHGGLTRVVWLDGPEVGPAEEAARRG